MAQIIFSNFLLPWPSLQSECKHPLHLFRAEKVPLLPKYVGPIHNFAPEFVYPLVHLLAADPLSSAGKAKDVHGVLAAGGPLPLRRALPARQLALHHHRPRPPQGEAQQRRRRRRPPARLLQRRRRLPRGQSLRRLGPGQRPRRPRRLRRLLRRPHGRRALHLLQILPENESQVRVTRDLPDMMSTLEGRGGSWRSGLT